MTDAHEDAVTQLIARLRGYWSAPMVSAPWRDDVLRAAVLLEQCQIDRLAVHIAARTAEDVTRQKRD